MDGSSPTALLITDVTMNGGVTTHLLDVIRVAHQSNWELDVLIDHCPGMDSSVVGLSRAGVRVHRGPLHPRDNSESAIRSFVLERVAIKRPDIIHIQCGSPRSALLPRQLAIACSIPLLFTEHYIPSGKLPEETLIHLRELYRRAFAVISLCEANRTVLRHDFRLVADQHVVIPNGVTLRALRPEPVAPPRSAVCVARLTHQKGIDVLLHAIAALRNSACCRMRFTVFGDGALQPSLQRLATDLGVADRVHFAGWVADPPSRLGMYDLFVLPSRSEGQPIALLEALAAGLPCIASAVSGIPEALGDGVRGKLVPPDDPQALASAILSHHNAPAVLHSKAAAARGHLQSSHNSDTNARRILAVWGAAMASGASTWNTRERRTS